MNRDTAMKIAVSVPAKTLRSVELERNRTGRSRSSIVTEALESWLRLQGADEGDRRYLEAYERHPEPEESAVGAAILATWDSWEPSSAPVRKTRARTRRAR